MDTVLLATARALLRIPGARALVRRAERHPVTARWTTELADRMLGNVGNYRLALQSHRSVPSDACLDAVFALAEPRRPAQGGPNVLVIDDLGPGGAQRQLVLTALGLKAAGYADLRVLCRSPSAVDPERGGFFRTEIERADLRVEVLGALPGHTPASHPLIVTALGSPLASDTAALTALFREWRPDVVHAFSDWTSIAAGLAAHLTGVPRIILSGRNLSPPNIGLEHGALRPVYRRLLTRPHVTLTNNSLAGAQDYARWLDIAQDRIEIVRNGFEQADGQTSMPSRGSRVRLGLPENGPLIGGIFRDTAEKDSELWLAVAANVCARHADARFIWFGGQSSRAQRRVRKLSLGDRVILRPAHRPIEDVYGAIDVLLSTSRVEGTPNVLIEAQWHGVPVVAPAVGGISETVEDGVTGRVIASRDSALLGDAVIETLGWPAHTPEFCRRGRELVKARFSTAAMIAATARLYGGAADSFSGQTEQFLARTRTC